MSLQSVSEGQLLKNFFKGKGYAMQDIADKLSMTRQNLSHHLRKEVLDANFLRLVEDRLELSDINEIIKQREPQKPAPIEGERISLNGVLPDISQKPAMQKIIEGESTESLLQAMATRILKMQTEIDLLKDAVFGKH